MSLKAGVPLVDIGDPDAPIGSRSWALWQRAVLIGLLYDRNSSVERLRGHLDAVKKHEGWRHLEDARGRRFRTYREFCCTRQPFGLGYDPDDIDRLCDDRLRTQSSDRVEMAALQTRLEDVPENGARTDLADSARLPRAERARQAGVHPDTQRKLDYLARNHADLLGQVRARQLSVDKAYRQARGLASRTSVPLTVDGLVKAILGGLSAEQIVELVRRLGAEP